MRQIGDYSAVLVIAFAATLPIQLLTAYWITRSPLGLLGYAAVLSGALYKVLRKREKQYLKTLGVD